jgi:hypothetical protein
VAEKRSWGHGYQDLDLVFTREDGSPLDPGYVTKHMQLIANRAGLPRRRLHDLRHGAASLQLAAGVPMAVVSKRLGHSSLSMTADTYSHLLEGVGRQAAEAGAAMVPRAAELQSREDMVRTTAKSAVIKRTRKDIRAGQKGAPSGTRTPNPLIKSQLLCQLS